MVHSIDKASKGIWKCYIGSIPILGVSVVQVHISDLQRNSPTGRKAKPRLPVRCLYKIVEFINVEVMNMNFSELFIDKSKTLIINTELAVILGDLNESIVLAVIGGKFADITLIGKGTVC